MPRPRMKRHAVTQPSDPSYRLIPLTQGQNAVVDVSDYEQLNQFNWCAQWSKAAKSFYAMHNERDKNGKKYLIQMGRKILNCKPGEEADHWNHDTLDNRRKNLRKATKFQNASNRKIRSNNTSGYIGVSRRKNMKKWKASIICKNLFVHLGYFTTAEEAARARDKAAKKLQGEFATLNFKITKHVQSS